MARVALFIPCFVDQLSPQIGLDTAEVLRRAGYEVDFPKAQTCCGQPAFNTGYWNDARPLAARFVRVFRSYEAVVSPSGSCTTMVRNFYPELLAGTSSHGDAVDLGKRVFELSEFLIKVAHRTGLSAEFPHRVAYHDACHALRELGLKQEPRELLRHVQGLHLVEMPYSEDCCGFGGTFATKFHMISAAMGNSKASNAEKVSAEYITSTDPSCLMHIEGILRRRNSPVRTIHISAILATRVGTGVAPSRLSESEGAKRQESDREAIETQELSNAPGGQQ